MPGGVGVGNGVGQARQPAPFETRSTLVELGFDICFASWRLGGSRMSNPFMRAGISL